MNELIKGINLVIPTANRAGKESLRNGSSL